MKSSTRIDLRSYRGGPAGHRHDHHQVVVALEGGMTLEVDGRTSRVSRRVAALVPVGTTHAFEACRDNRFLVIDVTAGEGDRFDAPWRAARSHPFVAVADDVRGYLDFLATRAAGGALPDALAGPASQLAIGLLGAGTTSHRSRQAPLPDSVVRACRLMASRLDRSVSVADIAAHAGKSPARLHALFREHLGTTPQRWLLERRMNEASRLLVQTHRSVERIAMAVGFTDPSAFGRAFRRLRAETPRGYRVRRHANERLDDAVDESSGLDSRQDSREP